MLKSDTLPSSSYLNDTHNRLLHPSDVQKVLTDTRNSVDKINEKIETVEKNIRKENLFDKEDFHNKLIKPLEEKRFNEYTDGLSYISDFSNYVNEIIDKHRYVNVKYNKLGDFNQYRDEYSDIIDIDDNKWYMMCTASPLLYSLENDIKYFANPDSLTNYSRTGNESDSLNYSICKQLLQNSDIVAGSGSLFSEGSSYAFWGFEVLPCVNNIKDNINKFNVRKPVSTQWAGMMAFFSNRFLDVRISKNECSHDNATLALNTQKTISSDFNVGLCKSEGINYKDDPSTPSNLPLLEIIKSSDFNSDDYVWFNDEYNRWYVAYILESDKITNKSPESKSYSVMNGNAYLTKTLVVEGFSLSNNNFRRYRDEFEFNLSLVSYGYAKFDGDNVTGIEEYLKVFPLKYNITVMKNNVKTNNYNSDVGVDICITACRADGDLNRDSIEYDNYQRDGYTSDPQPDKAYYSCGFETVVIPLRRGNAIQSYYWSDGRDIVNAGYADSSNNYCKYLYYSGNIGNGSSLPWAAIPFKGYKVSNIKVFKVQYSAVASGTGQGYPMIDADIDDSWSSYCGNYGNDRDYGFIWRTGLDVKFSNNIRLRYYENENVQDKVMDLLINGATQNPLHSDTPVFPSYYHCGILDGMPETFCFNRSSGDNYKQPVLITTNCDNITTLYNKRLYLHDMNSFSPTIYDYSDTSGVEEKDKFIKVDRSKFGKANHSSGITYPDLIYSNKIFTWKTFEEYITFLQSSYMESPENKRIWEVKYYTQQTPRDLDSGENDEYDRAYCFAIVGENLYLGSNILTPILMSHDSSRINTISKSYDTVTPLDIRNKTDLSMEEIMGSYGNSRNRRIKVVEKDNEIIISVDKPFKFTIKGITCSPSMQFRDLYCEVDYINPEIKDVNFRLFTLRNNKFLFMPVDEEGKIWKDDSIYNSYRTPITYGIHKDVSMGFKYVCEDKALNFIPENSLHLHTTDAKLNGYIGVNYYVNNGNYLEVTYWMISDISKSQYVDKQDIATIPFYLLDRYRTYDGIYWYPMGRRDNNVPYLNGEGSCFSRTIPCRNDIVSYNDEDGLAYAQNGVNMANYQSQSGFDNRPLFNSSCIYDIVTNYFDGTNGIYDGTYTAFKNKDLKYTFLFDYDYISAPILGLSIPVKHLPAEKPKSIELNIILLSKVKAPIITHAFYGDEILNPYLKDDDGSTIDIYQGVPVNVNVFVPTDLMGYYNSLKDTWFIDIQGRSSNANIYDLNTIKKDLSEYSNYNMISFDQLHEEPKEHDQKFRSYEDTRSFSSRLNFNENRINLINIYPVLNNTDFVQKGLSDNKFEHMLRKLSAMNFNDFSIYVYDKLNGSKKVNINVSDRTASLVEGAENTNLEIYVNFFEIPEDLKNNKSELLEKTKTALTPTIVVNQILPFYITIIRKDATPTNELLNFDTYIEIENNNDMQFRIHCTPYGDGVTGDCLIVRSMDSSEYYNGELRNNYYTGLKDMCSNSFTCYIPSNNAYWNGFYSDNNRIKL